MENSYFIIEGDKIFKLTKPEIMIGRAQESDLIVNEPRVSRRHAKVLEATSTNGQFLINDLGSSGGTLVNGRPIVQKLLEAGDTVSLAGGFSMIFQIDPALIPPDAIEYKSQHQSDQATQMTGMLDPSMLPDFDNQD